MSSEYTVKRDVTELLTNYLEWLKGMSKGEEDEASWWDAYVSPLNRCVSAGEYTAHGHRMSAIAYSIAYNAFLEMVLNDRNYELEDVESDFQRSDHA